MSSRSGRASALLAGGVRRSCRLAGSRPWGGRVVSSMCITLCYVSYDPHEEETGRRCSVLRRPSRAAAPCRRGGGASAAASVHPQQWPRLAPALPPDPLLEARIERLLRGMSASQRVGQLIQGDIGSVTPDDLRRYQLGSVLNGGDSSPHGDKLAAPSEWLKLADRFYDAAVSGTDAAAIPALWGTDAVHGHNNIPGATLFPHNIALGAARDPQLVRRIGEITALEVRV